MGVRPDAHTKCMGRGGFSAAAFRFGAAAATALLPLNMNAAFSAAQKWMRPAGEALTHQYVRYRCPPTARVCLWLHFPLRTLWRPPPPAPRRPHSDRWNCPHGPKTGGVF